MKSHVHIVVGVVRAEGGIEEVGGQREEGALEVEGVCGDEVCEEVDIEGDNVCFLGGPA